MDVFISYSRQDAPIARTIADRLEAAGHAAFIDYLGIGGGEEFVQVLGQAIDACDMVLVLLSASAIDSQWVRWEIGWALRQRKLIVPILLESVSFAAIFPLASLHHLDFRDASDPAREAALRALNDLLALAPPARPEGASRFDFSSVPRGDESSAGPTTGLSEAETYRLATESIAARGDRSETAAYLGRLVLQRSPGFLAGWFTDFVERIESELRQARIELLEEKLQDCIDVNDLSLAEQIAHDILLLDVSNDSARKALGTIQLQRQSSELYKVAQQVISTSRDTAFFLLTEVRRLCPDFPDRARLLEATRITRASACLVRKVAIVGPDVVDPHPHCQYTMTPAGGLVAVSDFYYRQNLWGDKVAVYAPGNADSLVILRPGQKTSEYQASVTSVTLSPDGRYVAAGTRFGETAIWETANPDARVQLATEGGVLKVLFAPAGDVLVTMTTRYPYNGRGTGPPATLSVWDAGTGHCRGRLPRQTESGSTERSLRWSAGQTSISFGNPPTIMAVMWDNYVHLWDYALDELIASLHIWHGAHTVGLGNEYMAVEAEQDLRLFKVAELRGSLDWREASSVVLRKKLDTRHLLFSPVGDILVAVSSTGRVELWDPATSQLLHSVETGIFEPKSIAFSGDGTLLFVQSAVLGVSMDAPITQWPSLRSG